MIFLTVRVERLPVRSSFREDDCSNDRGCAGVEEYVGLLVAGVRWEEVLDKLVLHEPGLSSNVEPNEDVCEGLEEKEGYQGEHRDEREEVPGGFPLGELVVGRRVADEEDGDGGQANVRHQVLIVTGLSSNLELSQSDRYTPTTPTANLRRRP